MSLKAWFRVSLAALSAAFVVNAAAQQPQYGPPVSVETAKKAVAAALAALLASGMDLPEATREALAYLDRCLDEGFRPGMGQVIPDRLFWALSEDAEAHGDDAGAGGFPPGADYFEVPFNETKH